MKSCIGRENILDGHKKVNTKCWAVETNFGDCGAKNAENKRKKPDLPIDKTLANNDL
jgi:hypothetical protein